MGRLFFGGIPTSTDVKKLEDRFGVPSPGVISHDEISACIGSPWRSNRYVTVVSSWRRKLLREHNIDTSGEPGVGIRILNGPERIDASVQDFRSMVRKSRKAAIRTSLVPDDDLDDFQRKRRNHIQQVSSRMYLIASQEVKALKLPDAAAISPRRTQIE